MAVFLVLIKTRGDDDSQQAHFEQLLSESYDGINLIDYVWLIESFATLKDLTKDLLEYTDNDDSIAVIPINQPFGFKKMPKGTIEWIQSKFE